MSLFKLTLKRLYINTEDTPVVYINENCSYCKEMGFTHLQHVSVRYKNKNLIAKLNTLGGDILDNCTATLCEYAFHYLDAKQGDIITLSHIQIPKSLYHIHRKINGKILTLSNMQDIIGDITTRYLTPIQIASFLTACASGCLNNNETYYLTKAMVDIGDKLSWGVKQVLDKHCIGGLPGNRTTPIVVAIVAAFGLTIPKTSSRAITSPAGTADTMEVFTKVDLTLAQMKHVVKKEKGCFIWGGDMALSPADNIIIHVEKEIGLDTKAQLVASILSKKVAAGSKHVLIDIPVGKTAKVQTQSSAKLLAAHIKKTGKRLGLDIKVVITDGSQPIGFGIGPCLEARDVLAVLKGEKHAPCDLRQKALQLAGLLLEFGTDVKKGQGRLKAKKILDSGQAFEKFKAICLAQGGFCETIEKADATHTVFALKEGRVKEINNFILADLAKLAGAPRYKPGGVDMHVKQDQVVPKGGPLFTIHTASPYQLAYVIERMCDMEQAVLLG